jgi:hypothetical protein
MTATTFCITSDHSSFWVPSRRSGSMHFSSASGYAEVPGGGGGGIAAAIHSAPSKHTLQLTPLRRCCSGCDDMCCSGCDDMCCSGCDDMCCSGCDDMCCSGCDDMCCSGCDGRCCSGCDDMCCSGCDGRCCSGCDGRCCSGCDDRCCMATSSFLFNVFQFIYQVRKDSLLGEAKSLLKDVVALQ